MNKIKIAACAALGMISLAVSSYGQVTINMSDGDMLLGFRTANAPGNTLNLEVDLGSFSQFTLMNGGSFLLPQLSVLDLQEPTVQVHLGSGAISFGVSGRAASTRCQVCQMTASLRPPSVTGILRLCLSGKRLVFSLPFHRTWTGVLAV